MSRKRKRGEVHVSIRLYWGQDDDLIGWLEQFDGQPYGLKTQAVKEALRRSLAAEGEPAPADRLVPGSPAAGSEPGRVDLSGQSLAEVRRVVEAALASALARFEGPLAGTAAAAPGEDDEAEDLLDALGDSLILGDRV